MWCTKLFDNIPYVIRIANEDSIYKVIVSNLSTVWSSRLTIDEIYKISTELNPLIEADKDTIVSKSMQLFEHTDVEWSLVDTKPDLFICLQSELCGHPFIFKVRLIPSDSLGYYQEMTEPLLFGIQELLRRQNLLFDLLKKKDLEITEYKMEGGALPRNSVETPIFIKDDFLQSCDATLLSSSLSSPEITLYNISSLYERIYKTIRCKELQKDCKIEPKFGSEGFDENKPKISSEMSLTEQIKIRNANTNNKRELFYDDDSDTTEDCRYSDTPIPSNNVAPTSKKIKPNIKKLSNL